ncbi:MAG TPA: D-2-hydroxyacid dehydrogenase [Sandaracinaceae bacterium LLY-WYZ-13_1]|nr:D-2-hydroxyacid dehydrogenase [Sandaracinaceae bacterium LLY-WYZ-13_1]
MTQRTIHVYHPRPEGLAERIRARAPDRPIVAWTEEAQLRRGLGDVEVLFAPLPPRTGWTGATRLALLQVAGAGVDHFLPSPDLPGTVQVASLRGVFADDVADHAMMLLLALTRGLPQWLDQQRARVWKKREVRRLRGRTVVVLGLGAIGRAVAARASACGMRVEGVRRRAEPAPGVSRVHRPEALADAARGADALVVCVPRTPATEGLVDAAVIDALEDGAALIDVGRGGVVDEPALLSAVRAGRLLAGRDVFDEEPLPDDSPWWSAPNTIVTPHLAGLGEGYLDRAIDVLLDNVARLERGEALLHLVDRAAGY